MVSSTGYRVPSLRCCAWARALRSTLSVLALAAESLGNNLNHTGDDDLFLSSCPHIPAATMLSTSRSSAMRAISSAAPSTTPPAFLVPSVARAFSASAASQSQIGRAPLSIPENVDFSVTYPKAPKVGRLTAVQQRPTVRISGPLGELSMTIPPFVNIEHDVALKKAFVTVEDREIRKQREMWGA